MNYRVIVKGMEEFRIHSNVEIYESDSFVLGNESYYVHFRQGNTLHAKPITKTVSAFQ